MFHHIGDELSRLLIRHDVALHGVFVHGIDAVPLRRAAERLLGEVAAQHFLLHFENLCRVHGELTQAHAKEQPGDISGETLINHDDPREILVISLWQSIENWLKWKNNRERKANETIFERYLEGPTEYGAYVLGTYPVKKTTRKLNPE